MPSSGLDVRFFFCTTINIPLEDIMPHWIRLLCLSNLMKHITLGPRGLHAQINQVDESTFSLRIGTSESEPQRKLKIWIKE